MTQSPNDNNNSGEIQLLEKPSKVNRWRKFLIWIGVTLLIGVGSSAAIAWYFIQRQLAPLVEKNLTNALDRPLNLGKVEGFGLNSIYFGNTELPATSTDTDWLKLDKIQVSFNLWDFINPFQEREKPILNININLINPNIYIEQDRDLRWVVTRLKKTQTGNFEVKVNQIELQNARLTLVPRNKNKLLTPIQTNIPRAFTYLSNNYQKIEFNLGGTLNQKKSYQIQGKALTDKQETDLQISGKDLDIAMIAPLLPIPLDLTQGTIDSNVQIKIKSNQKIQLYGLINLHQVTGKIKQLAHPFINSNGNIIFQGRQIKLLQVKSQYGQGKGLVSGIIDLEQGLFLNVQTEPILIKDLITTLKIPKPSIKIEGELQANLKVTGKFTQPLLTAEVISKQNLLIDKIRFKSLTGNLTFFKGSLLIQSFVAIPTFGGKMVGQGQIILPQQDLLFDVALSDISANQIASIYQKKLSVKSAIINQARFKVIGNFKSLKNTLALGDGNIKIGKSLFTFNNLKIQLNQNGFWQGLINAVNLDLDDFLKQLKQQNNLSIYLKNSQIIGGLNLTGTLESFALSTLQGQGNVIIANEKANFEIQNLQFNRGQWTSNLKIQNLQLQDDNLREKKIVNGLLFLTGKLPNFNLAQFQTSGKGTINFNGQNLDINSLNIADQKFKINTNLYGFPLRKIYPQLAIPLNSFFSGNLNILGRIDQVKLNQLTGEVQGIINLGDGIIQTNYFKFAQGYWQTNAILKNIKVKQLNEQIPQRLSPIINSQVNLSGKLENFTLESLSGSGLGRVTFPGGLVNIPNFSIKKGDFNAKFNPQNLFLSSFSSQFPGTITGMILLSGNLNKLTLNAFNAQGNLNFNNIIKNQAISLNSVFNWDGQRLNLGKLSTNGITSRGFVDINTQFLGQIKAIENINLQVTANNFNLDNFEIKTAYNIPLNLDGLINFNGQVKGTGINPEFLGDLNLTNFALDSLKFDPILQGSITINKQEGTDFNLTSEGDQISFKTDPDFQPISATIKRDQILAKLTNQQDHLVLNINQFPLESLRNIITLCQKNDCLQRDFPPIVQRLIPPTLLAQNLAGQVSSNLEFYNNNKTITGNVKIDQPVVGRIRGDSFNLDLNYQNSLLTLNNSTFIKNQSVYQFDLSVSNNNNKTQFNLNSQIKKGDIQELLMALQIFEIKDLGLTLQSPEYGTAKDLFINNNSPNICNPTCNPLFSVGVPDGLIIDQLRRFSEIQAFQQKQKEQEQENFKLPKLRELTGKFDAIITAQSDSNDGLKSNFEISGEKQINERGEMTQTSWQWGNFIADQIKIKGQYNNGIFQIVPLIIQSDKTIINFNGTVGGATQSGEITVNNLPLSSLKNFINFPQQIGFTGILNGKANFSGNSNNPTALGSMTIVDATINQTPVESTSGLFNYKDAKLNFSLNSILSEGAEPLTIQGYIPYQLPFASIAPDTNEINLAFNLKNQNLALLNILTKNKIKWLDGQGEVNLNISGFLEPQRQKPTLTTAVGVINLNNATLAADVLPEDNLTGVTGKINFDFDTLKVDEIIGEFGGGKIIISGDLPLTNSQPQDNPLTVVLDNLSVDLKRIYEGDVKGQVTIRGNTQSPMLSGFLELFNGRILLPNQEENNQNKSENEDENLRATTKLDQLELYLGENIQITRPPILNFLAEGNLIVKGTLHSPQPKGIIRLKRGQVNLFTTQLGLAGGHKQIAQFYPERGLDPYLNLRLATSVAETTSSPLPEDPFSSEVNDIPVTNFGQLQTIRIEAEVNGFASQLTDSLTFRSNPSRSQTEIVALLGGGFVNTLGQDDPSLGLANLAGSAILGTVQDSIGQALGLTEFRLFPTSILDDKGRNTTLGLAAEASVDVTEQLSVSALKILTTEQPAQFGLRYRLDDNLILRGSTDFSGDSRAAFEYEIRF